MANVLKIIERMKATFVERGELYGDNYTRIGPVLKALFPDGITLHEADEHNRFHLYLMIMVKMTRLACTELRHKDSVHDIAVYAVMYEALLEEQDG